MLTREENDMLVHTGPGTPMGALFRRFWIPALLSEELPHPDCPPVRLTLLNEPLIAFKDTQGRIGLLERYCPHRLADLFWGRNEECGLRCAYHGWKFDVEGNCLDIPNAPEGETFKQKVRSKAYPTVERAGIVWAYMGPGALMPELPAFEWTRVPESHRYVSKFLVEGNYAQALEGEVDSSHVSFLHSRVDSEYGAGSGAALGPRQPYLARDKAPRWVTQETAYGLMLAAQRHAAEHTFHWRINQFFMPFTVSIATPPGVTMRCNVRVPIDDEHSWQYRVRWNPDRPLTEEELAEYKYRGVDYPELLPGTYMPKENKHNDYLIDRAAQRTYSFTGIKSLPAQDMAVQADQGGVIADRTREHLVSSDAAIIALRRRLLTAARDLLAGREPLEAQHPAAYSARAMDILLDRSTPLEEGMQEYAAASWDVPQLEVVERIEQKRVVKREGGVVMASEDIALMAHLMRRAGFGASRDELEARVAKGYEATVEELLCPAEEPVDRYAFLRYHPGFYRPITLPGMGSAAWLHTLINTKRPLEEKMVLFWHHVFATGTAKVDHYHELIAQTDMLREQGMGNYRDLLVALAKNPAMIYWLDNCDNHGHAVNENWGRELLELFSLGVGMDGHPNYTETDVREASRAFTGWTIAPVSPRNYYGRFDWEFVYQDEDHDDGEKTFLGHTGRFTGEDIIDIIVQQPACHRFIARHLYNFFVADEPQVPAWQTTPPRDPQAIETLATAFRDAHYDMRATLRVLFNADFFKNAQFGKMKSPAEVVVGSLRLAGGFAFPAPGIGNLAKEPGYMGQDLLNPPSVEGWHPGVEWINSGSLMKRINFAAGVVGETSHPGIRAIIDRLKAQGDLTPEGFADSCLDLLGPMTVQPETRQNLVAHASEGGTLRWGMAKDISTSTARVGEMLQLIASVREFQYC